MDGRGDSVARKVVTMAVIVVRERSGGQIKDAVVFGSLRGAGCFGMCGVADFDKVGGGDTLGSVCIGGSAVLFGD